MGIGSYVTSILFYGINFGEHANKSSLRQFLPQ